MVVVSPNKVEVPYLTRSFAEDGRNRNKEIRNCGNGIRSEESWKWDF